MGRANEMEKDIEVLKLEVKKLENIVRGMSNSIDEMEDKSTKTKHIDLVDDVKVEENTNGKKANDEGDGKVSSSTDKSSGSSNGKTKKNRNSSKWIYSL